MATAKKPVVKTTTKKAPAKKVAAKVPGQGGAALLTASSALTLGDLIDTVVAIEKNKEPPLPPDGPVTDDDLRDLANALRASPLPEGLTADQVERIASAVARMHKLKG